MARTSITVTTEIDLTVETAATWFCGLTDEQQAQFLIEVEKASHAWGGCPNTQWAYMIGHLRTCECSNEPTRQMVRDWSWFLDGGDSHAR